LLEKLEDALQDENNVNAMFPDARMKDRGMFEHLNFEFDLTGNKINVETAAKDYHGVPVYQYIYDSSDKQAIEIVNTEEMVFDEAP